VADLPPQYDSAAHGEARLRLFREGARGTVLLVADASWFTEEGDCQESSLTLAGDVEDAWQLVSEATTWAWKRWKRPMAQAALPFGP